jgi:hypothetical protein
MTAYTVTKEQLDAHRSTLTTALAQVDAMTGTPAPIPPNPEPIPPTPGEGVKFLGDFSAQGGPRENGVPDMAAGVTYVRRQFISGMGGGTMQFQSGYLTGYDLPNFESWLSGTSGGEPLPFPGCEREELQGSNIAARFISLAQLTGAGVMEVFFCLRAKGPTGRYMQRTP